MNTDLLLMNSTTSYQDFSDFSDDDEDEDMDCMMMNNEQIIKESTSTLVHLYAKTRVRICIDFDFVDLSNEEEMGPDMTVDDILKYGNKIAVSIDDLPKFNGETYFIFSLQHRDHHQCRELFRCVCVDGSLPNFVCNNVFIDFHDAMSTLIQHSRIIVTHGSTQDPWSQAVHFQAEIKSN